MMDRRSFVTSAVGATLPVGPPIRIAFLGGSHSHSFDKTRVVREHPGWQLAGIAEDDPQVRSRYEKDGVAALTRQQILNDASLRVVAVGSAVQDHARDALEALEAGKHVHLEKPPADNLRDFRRMVEIAGRKQLLLQMGYMWRHNPALNGALEAARSGRLGDIYLVRGTMNTLIGADRRPEWGLFRGGQMFEQGCHILDPIVRLLGRPEKITTFLRKHGAFDDHLADNTAAVLEYPRALALITASVLQPNALPHRFFEIMGSQGTAVVRPIEPPALEIDLAGRRDRPPMPAYRRYVADFAELEECVRAGRPLRVNPQEDLLVQETLIQASRQEL